MVHQPLEIGKFYHIYNRGINGTNLFYEEQNYAFFLEKYAHYLGEVLDTFAYCLLKNHFHFLVRVKDLSSFSDLSGFGNLTGLKKEKGLHSPEHFVSKKFSDFFNSYTKSINQAQGRTGKLLETPFRRILVEEEAYFSQLIWYIHFNPQKHQFVKDYRDYPHSSYYSHLSNKKTRLAREEVLEWFGSSKTYENFHQVQHNEKDFRDLLIEFD